MSELVSKERTHVKVLDIPAEATPAETEALVERHAGDSYLVAVVPWLGGARLFMRRHASASVARSTLGGLDAVVSAMYRQEPHASVEAVRKALQGVGIRKGTDAVREALARARAAAGQ